MTERALTAVAASAVWLQGHKGELQQMYEDWPFFAATIDLIEMILAKADMRIAALYDDVLVSDPAGKKLGIDLRQKFADTVRAICEVSSSVGLGCTGRVCVVCCPCPVCVHDPSMPCVAVLLLLFAPQVTGHHRLLETNPALRRLIEMRNPYIDPINILQVRAVVCMRGRICRRHQLSAASSGDNPMKPRMDAAEFGVCACVHPQVEVLRRARADSRNTRLREALLITINGIAAGMRNTG